MFMMAQVTISLPLHLKQLLSLFDEYTEVSDLNININTTQHYASL
jgi:hypothetical protein